MEVKMTDIRLRGMEQEVEEKEVNEKRNEDNDFNKGIQMILYVPLLNHSFYEWISKKLGIPIVASFRATTLLNPFKIKNGGTKTSGNL